MKTITLLIAGLGIAAATVPTIASAQPRGYQSVHARQDNLDRRIDVGLRNGSLTRAEAGRLRGEFRALDQLENRYRAGGLSQWERRDLDRRFDGLSSRIRDERHDRQDRRRR